MTKRKAKKQALEQIAKDQHRWHAMKALEQRRAEAWMMNIYRPVIPPGIARWLKP